MFENNRSADETSKPATKVLAALVIIGGTALLAIRDQQTQPPTDATPQSSYLIVERSSDTGCGFPEEWTWDEETCKTNWANWEIQPANWGKHVKRSGGLGQLLIPHHYIDSHSVESQEWFCEPENCFEDFESVWWDPNDELHQIRLIGRSKDNSTPWIKEEIFTKEGLPTQLFDRIYDPSAVIEEALLDANPSLLGEVAEITERFGCRFDFTATAEDGTVTKGIWTPHWSKSNPLGYYLLITTGMDWEDSWAGDPSSPLLKFPDFERNFWHQFLENSGHNERSFNYLDDRWGEANQENCFSLTKMVLDGETRTILNETFPFNGFIDDFTDLPCDEPIPEEVRAWYYERYGNSSNHTGEFADASYGNEELANFQYANIVPESSGPVVLELLAQDSCYWFDKNKSIRNPWDKNTTMTLHPEVDPLPGSVIGIIEGEERDQLIVGKSAGPKNEWVGSPALVRDFNVCCETPYTLEVYEWVEGNWREVEDALGERVETSEAIAVAPFQAINPSLKGCSITFDEQYIPEEPNYPIPPKPTDYEVKKVTISCDLSTPLLGLGPLYNDVTVSKLRSYGLKSFSYEIIEGSAHDDLINDQIRNFFGNTLAFHLDRSFLPKSETSPHIISNWWSGAGGTAWHDNMFFSVVNMFTYDDGGTMRYGEKEYITYFVETGEILEISDLFIGGDYLWKEIFSENAHQVTEGYDCRKYSEEEYGDGNPNSLVMTSDVWPTAEGLMSQNTLDWTKTYANNCRHVMWLTPWEHFSDIADPDGLITHFIDMQQKLSS